MNNDVRPLIHGSKRTAWRMKAVFVVLLIGCSVVAISSPRVPRRQPVLGSAKGFTKRVSGLVDKVKNLASDSRGESRTSTAAQTQSRVSVDTAPAAVSTPKDGATSAAVNKPKLKKDNKLTYEEEARKALLLKQLPKHRVFSNFVEIMQIPRASFKEQRVRDWAIQKGTENGCSVETDEHGNLLLRRPASPGYENAPKVAIQAHMDMVCEQANGKLHNFDVDPITGYVEDGWLKADRTTLGADNGIGVAAAIAILQEPKFKAGQIEILLTSAEEKDMRGAAGLSPGFLNSDIMINVDSESEHQICAGSAGGFGKKITKQAGRSPLADDDVGIALEIGNLAGGHTGVDIHEQRANAILVWGRLMGNLIESNINLRMVTVDGGSAHNAIPRQLKAIFYVPSKDLATATKILHDQFRIIYKEYENFEANSPWQLDINRDENLRHFPALTVEESRKMVDTIMFHTDGVERMNGGGIEGVETSVTLSKLKLNPITGQYNLEYFARSSNPSRLNLLNQRLNAVARLNDAIASEKLRPFPEWTPRTKSQALRKAIDSHVSLFKTSPQKFSVHAGLECGIIAKKFPSLDIISIGPTILGAHTIEERLKVDSVIPFYKWLRQMVKEISDGKKSKLDVKKVDTQDSELKENTKDSGFTKEKLVVASSAKNAVSSKNPLDSSNERVKNSIELLAIV
mmetsp:Transcript_31690/g.59088  ORF Transcript_31690/g.59088 Transcript_31690/m.59088 type:complete len:685 (-) Transcript_31690:105-2159(-)